MLETWLHQTVLELPCRCVGFCKHLLACILYIKTNKKRNNFIWIQTIVPCHVQKWHTLLWKNTARISSTGVLSVCLQIGFSESTKSKIHASSQTSRQIYKTVLELSWNYKPFFLFRLEVLHTFWTQKFYRFLKREII